MYDVYASYPASEWSAENDARIDDTACSLGYETAFAGCGMREGAVREIGFMVPSLEEAKGLRAALEGIDGWPLVRSWIRGVGRASCEKRPHARGSASKA